MKDFGDYFTIEICIETRYESFVVVFEDILFSKHTIPVV